VRLAACHDDRIMPRARSWTYSSASVPLAGTLRAASSEEGHAIEHLGD
jgi:hypothetical protein